MHDQMPIEPDSFFELDMVEKMCRGNKDKVHKMIVTFIDTVIVAVNEIKQAYQQMDMEALQRTAHRIKPMLAIYGIVQVEAEIDLMAKKEMDLLQMNELGVWVKKIETVLISVTEKMKEEFLTR